MRAPRQSTLRWLERLIAFPTISSHSDVVPVEGQMWSSDPFHAEIRGDRIFGRGACDMKGFLAVAISRRETLRAAALPFPVHLAISYDQEVGCLRAPHMIADKAKLGFAPELCVVGEPTKMKIVNTHKSLQLIRCIVQGRAAHSSLPHIGVNAIDYAARLIAHVGTLAERAS